MSKWLNFANINESKPEFRFRWQVLVATAVFFGLAYAFMSTGTFYSPDTGLRFLQIRELVAQNWETLSIRYPARIYDPDLANVPYYYGYSIIDNELYLSISPYFPILTSIFYAIIGDFALPIVSVGSGILVGLAAYGIVRLGTLPKAINAFWMSIFATPVVFYGLLLWDHTMAAAGGILSVYFFLRGVIQNNKMWLFVSGGIIGLFLGVRPEFYVFAIAFGIGCVVLFRKNLQQLKPIIIGGMVTVIPLFLLQYRWYGHMLGIPVATHIFGYGVPDSYPVESYSNVDITRPMIMSRLLLFVESHDLVTFLAVLTLVFGMAWIVLGFRRDRLGWLILGAFSSWVGYGIYMFVAFQTNVTGLLSTFPLISFSIIAVLDVLKEPGGRDRKIIQFVATVTTIFVGLMVLFWPSFGGEQWGARYMIVAYPLLVILAIFGMGKFTEKYVHHELYRIVKFIPLSLIIASVLLQGVAIIELAKGKQELLVDKQSLEALPVDIVLTNHPFIPSFMTAVSDKTFMYVSNEIDLENVMDRLWEKGQTRFALIPMTIPDTPLAVSIDETKPYTYFYETPFVLQMVNR